MPTEPIIRLKRHNCMKVFEEIMCFSTKGVDFDSCRLYFFGFFFSSRRRHTRYIGDWSSDVCSSDLIERVLGANAVRRLGAEVGLEEPQYRSEDRHAGQAELAAFQFQPLGEILFQQRVRSEERRVGKEREARYVRYEENKKTRK